MKYDYTNEPDHLIIGKKELVIAELVLQVGKTVKRGDIVDKDGAIITDTGKYSELLQELPMQLELQQKQLFILKENLILKSKLWYSNREKKL